MLPAELDTTVTTTTTATTTASWAQIVMHVTVEKYANAAKVEVGFFFVSTEHTFSLSLALSPSLHGRER